MKKTNKLISLLLSLVIILSAVVVFPTTAKAAGLSLSDLMRKFPDGAYWNHVTNGSHGYADCHDYGSCNNPDGYTWSPCYSHKVDAPNGYTDCNSFAYSMQCCGFAKKIANDVYGSNPVNWGQVSVWNCKPGDVIHYWGGGADATWGHWVMVIARNGDTLTFGECNVGGRCQISWHRTLYIGSMSSSVCYSAPWLLPDSSPISKPNAPGSITLKSTTLGKGDSIVASWSSVNGANSYTAKLICNSNSAYNQQKDISGTSVSFALNNEGSYYVSVCAKNSAGSSGYTNSGSATVYPNKTVTWMDYDGTVIKTQSVKYNGNATPPAANPTREGYTFHGWDKGYNNITADTTITATYKINVYSVTFIDYNGNTIGDIQRIEYKSSAVPPTDIPTRPGYVFTDWNSSEYKEVKKNLTIKAIYEWENPNLPIILDITSAVRNEEATGYDISVKMSSFPDSFTKGKLVVSLKTKEGKMVAVETHSISMPKDDEVTEDVTILYSGIVSTVEASLVGIIDDEQTGAPKATSDVAPIDIGNEWSGWSVNVPSGDDIITDSRTEYRYKDTKIIKAVSQPATPPGYSLLKSEKTGTYTNWSSWGDYTTTYRDKTNLQDRRETIGYRFHTFICNNCGSHEAYSGPCDYCGSTSYSWDEVYYPASGYSIQQGGVDGKGIAYIYGKKWYFEYNETHNGWTGYGQPTCTMYGYRTRQEYINYYYKQTSFSDWQPEPVSASSTREVETRTTYRFKTNSTEVPCYNYKRYKYTNLNNGKTIYTYSSAYPDSMDYSGEWEFFKSFTELQYYSKVDETVDLYNGIGEDSWYRADVNNESVSTKYETVSTLEDTEGINRHFEGTLENAANKVVTMIVYKGKNSDPTANQIEFISQKTTDENGFYSFDFITKEEPSLKTGDFIVGIGVEGGTEYIEIDKILAPKPVYIVDFIDDGNLLMETNVVEGCNAEAPADPVKEGYEFIGWDTALKNVQENMVVSAVFRENNCTVVFVDWDNSFIDIKEFPYGSELTADKVPEKEGKRFAGWTDDNDNNVIIVDRDMAVTAKYEDAKYTVTFYDSNGEIVKESIVKHGDYVEAPESVDAPSAKQEFVMWDSYDAEKFVTHSLAINPIFKYKEQASTPRFTVDSGMYKDPQTVGLYSLSANTKIYYLIMEDSEDNVQIDYLGSEHFTEYTEPITISKSSTIYAYATSNEKESSNPVSTVIKIDDINYGDVSGDNKVDVTDATLVQMFAAEFTDLTAAQKKAADTNHDGKVDVTDATMIRRYAAEFIDRF